MPSANIEIVMEGIRLFETEDFQGLEEMLSPDCRLTGPVGWPEPGPFEGRDAVIGQFRRLTDDMGEHHFSDVEVVTDDGGWVVLSFLWQVRGAGSGAPVATKLAGAWRVESGKFTETHFRWTADEALESTGLSE
jgi:SnoaL-like domain